MGVGEGTDTCIGVMFFGGFAEVHAIHLDVVEVSRWHAAHPVGTCFTLIVVIDIVIRLSIMYSRPGHAHESGYGGVLHGYQGGGSWRQASIT